LSVPNNEPFPRSGGTIRRKMSADRFTQIANAFFRDPNLSAKAKGIFGLISTHASGWNITVESLMGDMKDGRDAIRAGLKELEESGYLVRERIRSESGTLTGATVYVVSDVPMSDSPTSENPTLAVTRENDASPQVSTYVGKSNVGESPTKNTTPKNTSEKTRQPTDAADASRGEQVAEVDLFDQPAPPVQAMPTARDLVKAWCDGWADARGKSPDDSVVRRVAGSCGQIAKTRSDLESWRTAWQAAKDAGRQGRYDVVAHLADYQPPKRLDSRTNLGAIRTQQAKEQVHKLQSAMEDMNAILGRSSGAPRAIGGDLS